MCHSTLFGNSWKKIQQSFQISNSGDFENREPKRVFPRELNPVLIKDSEGSKIHEMTFALVPSWSKGQTVQWSTHNARLERVSPKTGRFERIYEVPSWRGSFGTMHCIVPTDIFYDVCTQGNSGDWVEYGFSQSSGPLYAAGLFSKWSAPNNKHAPFYSYAIITTDSSRLIKGVGYDRMPTFLSESNAARWLSEHFENPSLAFDFLKDSIYHPDLTCEPVRKIEPTAYRISGNQIQ